MSDLALVPIEELIEEIFARYRDGVIAVSRPAKVEGDKLATFKIRWQGDGFKAAGLASAAIEEINYYRRENESQADE